MSRYIDAEKELTELKAMKVEGETFTTAVNFAIITLEKAPSIDIVFCRECTKHNTHKCHMAFDLVATNDDDFCSYGERFE